MVKNGKLELKELAGDHSDNLDANGQDDTTQDDQTNGNNDQGSGADEEPKADDDDASGSQQNNPPPPAPVPPPVPPRGDIRRSYRRSLGGALKAGVNAFFSQLLTGEPPGSRADPSRIGDAARSGDVGRMADLFNPNGPQQRSSIEKTLKATMPMAKMAAITALGLGASMAAGAVVPAVLAMLFVNSILDKQNDFGSFSADSKLSDDEACDKLVDGFMDWVEKLDADKIRASVSDKKSSTSSASDLIIEPVNTFDGSADRASRYMVRRTDGEIVGEIQWARNEHEADAKSCGWKAAVNCGFCEHAYPTGKTSEYDDPFTDVVNGTLVLVNPTSMTLESARAWAFGIVRGE